MEKACTTRRLFETSFTTDVRIDESRFRLTMNSTDLWKVELLVDLTKDELGEEAWERLRRMGNEGIN